MFRIGTFYPDLDSDFVMADCPEFWHSHKIKINLLNMEDERYMENIQISAYVAIGLDLLVGISSIVIVLCFSKMRFVYGDSSDELGPWSLFGCSVGPFKPFDGFGKMKFILLKIILAFGLPLSDTVLGMGKLF